MRTENSSEDRFKIGARVSWGNMIANLGLVAFKLIAGIVGKSSAMVADAAHSASDLLATAVVIMSLRVSKRPADVDHPYGHGKAEPVAAKIVGLILIIAGCAIGSNSARKIAVGGYTEPGRIALVAAVVSIVVKEAMYRITAATAEAIESSAVMAEALHHRSDAYSSVGTFIGILGARLGVPVLDPIAGIVVAALIVKMGFEITRKSSDELMDAQADPDTLRAVQEAIDSVEGVSDVHYMAARRYGGYAHVDLRIGVDPSLSVVEGHNIAVAAEKAIKGVCPHVIGVMVHVDPESVHEDDPIGHGYADVFQPESPQRIAQPNAAEMTSVVEPSHIRE